jgi:hypothetical protein
VADILGALVATGSINPNPPVYNTVAPKPTCVWDCELDRYGNGSFAICALALPALANVN